MTAPHRHQLGDVSCRVTGYTVRQLVRMGLPTSHLTRGISFTLDELQVPSVSIPWDDYLVFLRNVSETVTPEQWRALCTSYGRSPRGRPLLSPAGPYFQPARYYEWIADPSGGALQRLFGCLEVRLARGAREVILEERVRAGYAPPPAWFWEGHAIGFSALTTQFGLAPAGVTWEPIERGASFRIVLPARRPLRFIRSWIASRFRRESAEDLPVARALEPEPGARLERELARQKAALMESEERLQRITAAIPGIVYQYYRDPDGREGFAFVSGGARALCGYTPEELIETPDLVWRQVLPEFVPSLRASILRSAREGTPSREEFQFRTRSGEVRWARGTSVPEPANGTGRVVWNGLLMDITAERAASDALAASELHVREVTKNLPGVLFQFVLTADRSFRVGYVSEGVRTLLGYAPEELLRADRNPFELIHADQRAVAYERMLESAATLGDWVFEGMVRRADGGHLWLRIRATPTRTPAGDTVWNGVALDVSEQKRAEDQVREHAARLEALTEASTAHINEIDRDGVIRYSTRASAGRTVGDLIGRRLIDFLNPDDGDRMTRVLNGVFETGEPYRGELVARDGTGAERTYSIVVSAIRTGGPIERVVLTGFDITDRVRAEDAVRRSEERFRRLLENGNEVVALYDAAGTIRYESPSVTRVLGFEPAEMIGMSSIGLCHPDDLQLAVESLTRILEQPGKAVRLEIRCRCKDGSYRWLDFVATNLLHEPAIGGIVGNYRDITEWRAATERLRARDELLRKLSEQVPGVIYQYRQSADGRGCFPYASEGIRAIYEVTPDEVLTSADTVSERLHPDDRDAVWASIRRSVEALEPWRFEYRVRLPVGGERWLEAHSAPERSPDGGTLWHGYIRDVTERKRAEAEVVRARDAAEQALGRLKGESARAEQFQRLVELAGQGVGIARLDGSITYLNPFFRLLLDLPATSDITRHTFWEFVPPEDHRFLAETVLPTARETGFWTGEFNLLTATGRRLSIINNVFVLRDPDGQVVGYSNIATDISALKRAEEQLRISEDRLQQAVRCAGIGIFDHDHRIDGFYWSQFLRTIYGWGPDEPGSLTEFLKMVHPGDSAAIGAAVRRAHDPAGDGSFDVEHRLIRKSDGAVRWLMTRSKTVFEGEGAARHPVRTFGAVMDITERKRAEDAIRESEEKLRAIVENEPECVQLLDRHGRLLEMNPAGLRMTGAATPDAALGTEFGSLVSAADRPAFDEMVEAVFRGEVRMLSYQMRGLTGTPRVLETHSVPMWAQDHREVRALLGVTRDVTERTRAEEALKESEERFRTYVDHAPIGVTVTDETGRYLEVNPATCRLTGYDRAELLARSVSDLTPPEWLSQTMTELERVNRTGAIAVELPILLKGGGQRWVSMAAVRLSDNRVMAFATDITERRASEQALRLSEHRLREAQTIASLGNWELDLTTMRLWWSEQIYCLFEVDPKTFGGTYQAFLDAVHPEDRDAVHAAYTRSLRERSVYQVTHRILHADGRVRFVEERCETDFAPDGTPLISRGTVQDVSARVEAERALRASETRYRTLFETCTDGVFLLDLSGGIRSANPAAARMHGYTMDELLAMRMQDLDVPESAALIPERMQRMRNGEVLTFEVSHQRKDGTVFPLEVLASAVELGGEWLVLAFDRDITERKRSEAALQEAEDRQRLALDAAGMGTWDWDVVAGRVIWDLREQELFGFAPGTYDGAPGTFFGRVHPDDVADVRRKLTEAVETGTDYEAEFRVYPRPGELRWLSGNGRLMRAADGTPSRMVGINYDITERKRAEELVVASLREKEALLKEIHHRVKNNLQVISSLLNLQAERIADPSARAVFLESQSRVRAMALVHETLYGSESLARIELPRYVERLCDSLLRTFGGGERITLERHIADATLDLDRALPVGLIVSELVSNALKYAFPNGRPGRIVVSVATGESSHYTLCVRDDGVGLPPDLDLDRTTSLGLYLVGVLVRQLRAERSVERSTGTAFTIRFPA
jgi:PAS domain S-box-containing protein